MVFFVVSSVVSLHESNATYTDMKPENILVFGDWPLMKFSLGDIETICSNSHVKDTGIKYYGTYLPFVGALSLKKYFGIITCFAACCTAIEMANTFAGCKEDVVDMSWADEPIQVLRMRDHPMCNIVSKNQYVFPWVEALSQMKNLHTEICNDAEVGLRVLREAVVKTQHLAPVIC